MTIGRRDMFAAAALQGILSSLRLGDEVSNPEHVFDGYQSQSERVEDELAKTRWARWAYTYADEMIEQGRRKRQ